MKLLAVLAIVFSVSFAICQEPTKMKPKPISADLAKQTVTQSEAREVFIKAGAVLKKRLHLTAAPIAISLKASEKPVTREEVVAQLSVLYKYASPAFKLTPKPTAYDPKMLKMDNQASMAQLLVLVKSGVVAERGRVAAGPADTLTVKEFGDAIGYFFVRIAQLSHLPSAKYSPGLMD